MITLKGAEVSAKIKEQVSEICGCMEGHIPTAALVRVGERPDDISYEKGAIKKIHSFGMEVRSYVFPEDIPEEDFMREFERINEDDEIDGILLFKPFPQHLNEYRIEMMIRPEKDLDGISPINTAKVFSGERDGFAPCTAEAVIEMLKANEIPIEGQHAIIVGRSMVVGRPLSMLLLKENATVTICHTLTCGLRDVCRQADILITAVGKARMITTDYMSDGAVVIDVGVNVDENGKLCGDVDWTGLEEKAKAATPVPGGVGAITTAVLCKNLAAAALRRYQKKQA